MSARFGYTRSQDMAQVEPGEVSVSNNEFIAYACDVDWASRGVCNASNVPGYEQVRYGDTTYLSRTQKNFPVVRIISSGVKVWEPWYGIRHGVIGF